MKRAIFALVICGWAGGQTARPAFEAASVKPAQIGVDGSHLSGGMAGGPGTGMPTRFTSTNMSLAVLMMRAYDVKRTQIVGPGWIDSECYDISAKVAEGATPAEFWLMLQRLVEERFQLKLHHEQKEQPVYELVVAKGGPKLKAPGGEAQAAGEPPAKKDRWAVDSNGYPRLDSSSPGTRVVNGRATMYEKQYSMDELADQLSIALGQAVRNGTGLTRRYDIVLRWATGGGGGPNVTINGAAESVGGPNLFEALQQQLGLKLESKKGLVDTLVIDHAETVPTAN